MNWLTRIFCRHTYEVLGAYNLHRSYDNKVIGHRILQRCTKCGHIEARRLP